MPDVPSLPTETELRSLNRILYSRIPLFQRALQVWRPTICPIEPLFAAVPQRCGSVLDVGSGRGMLLLNLFASGWISSGMGVEVSEKLVAQANTAKAQLAQHLGREVDVKFEYRRPEEVFDFDRQFNSVLAVDVVHHVPKELQADFVGQLLDLVVGGGTLVYKDMCIKPFWRSFANRLHDLAISRQWIHYFPIDSVKKIIGRKVEWSEARIETYSRLWYGHELVVAKNRGIE